MSKNQTFNDVICMLKEKIMIGFDKFKDDYIQFLELKSIGVNDDGKLILVSSKTDNVYKDEDVGISCVIMNNAILAKDLRTKDQIKAVDQDGELLTLDDLVFNLNKIGEEFFLKEDIDLDIIEDEDERAVKEEELSYYQDEVNEFKINNISDIDDSLTKVLKNTPMPILIIEDNIYFKPDDKVLGIMEMVEINHDNPLTINNIKELASKL